MSKITLAPNISGSGTFTIAAPNSNTDRTLTLPDAAGTIDTIQRAGNVLQVVNATYATNTQTTSGTYTDTGLSASITPSSASNKVLVIVHMQGSSNTSSSSYLGLQLLRGATVIVGLQNAAFYAGGNTRATISTCYLDSPATTSSTTYKVQMKSPAGGSVGISADGAQDVNTITLMEIAA